MEVLERFAACGGNDEDGGFGSIGVDGGYEDRVAEDAFWTYKSKEMDAPTNSPQASRTNHVDPSTSSAASITKLKDSAHKPMFGGIIVAVFVFVVRIAVLIRKYKARKQQKINDNKTRMMMRWHQDRGLVYFILRGRSIKAGQIWDDIAEHLTNIEKLQPVASDRSSETATAQIVWSTCMMRTNIYSITREYLERTELSQPEKMRYFKFLLFHLLTSIIAKSSLDRLSWARGIVKLKCRP
ncbi:MAG: hypothetical protein Q9192_002472 [Flavoplaca navasiana]